MQKMLSYVRRAVDHYHMIDEGDRIAVGVSGGKDSLALLVALSQLSRFYPHHFTVVAITLEMGYDEMDFSPVQTLCDKLGVEYIRVPTQIGPIVFDIRHEENPCSLCAKLRRGALHDAARKAGCSKVALGHHFDDVVETYMLSLLYEGRISWLAAGNLPSTAPRHHAHSSAAVCAGALCALVQPNGTSCLSCHDPCRGGRQHQATGDQGFAEKSRKDHARCTRAHFRRHAALPARGLGT